jgi:hypothetical protein
LERFIWQAWYFPPTLGFIRPEPQGRPAHSYFASVFGSS